MPATARNASNGAYAPLSVHYYQDDRIGDAGPLAELLFVRSIAYCAAMLSDGFMTEQQVRRFVAVGLDDVEDLCKRLVSVGLWDRDDDRDGYVIRQFLKWNRSREEITSAKARDAARKRLNGTRSEPPPDTEPTGSERSPNGFHADSSRIPDGTQHNTTQHNTAAGRTPPGSVRPAAADTTERPVAARPPDLTALKNQISQISTKSKSRPPSTPGDGAA